ncbi:MAG TPA: uracil-DNA glycosylase [Rhodanobacteraceae bacterium]|nr:uracil-DNA glycosylase [Rhodanobacteraceae bacterium]
MNAESFVQALASVRQRDVFNPYSDMCPVQDLTRAAAFRRQNLRSYLVAAGAIGVDTIWMGRDLGYRGGRRTGLALTDEAHLGEMETLYPGCKFRKATKGPTLAERTATEIWSILRKLELPPLLWNVFPFHPHEPGNPFSNRRFTGKELRAVEDINAALISWLRVKRIIAIGQDAAHYASRFDVTVVVVRHPSYGGVKEFRAGMATVYPASSPRRLASEQGALSL